jgi:hypothetical protein
MTNKYKTELTLLDQTISVSTLKIIRKYREGSYADIRNDVNNRKSILSCDSVDTEDYEQLLKCYEELRSNGIMVQLSENGVPITSELAYNWLDSMHETDEYVNSDDSWFDEDN